MADDLKMKIKLEVDNKVDTSKVKKQAENAGKEIGENVNKGMSGAIAKGMAIWDTIKGTIKKVWDMTKQFISDSISLANSYESAFAGVRKTVDGTAQEFARLDSSLKQLAKEIPLTYQELAGIMELGGQLGVDTKNLDKFTKAVAQLGTATNLTSEDAAQMLAQFANITKMDLNDIDRLGSVIVDLGNNFATTEANIVNFAQRIAGAGQIVGISQSNIMAIATAFSSVGIEAEAGGTAVQKVLLDINSAVTSGGPQLDKYAKILGVTNDEFKKMYQEHPEQIFVDFVKSLQGAGKEAQLLLDELGLSDQRLTRGFLSLSQNADILTEAIERSNVAWEENIALSNEAEQRYSTTESQIIMQQNERANIMAGIGEKLQGVALIWENVKTGFVEAIGSFLGVTTESSEATEMLKGQIEEINGAMDDLTRKFKEGAISIQEYARQKAVLEEKERDAKKALDEEIERREKLREKIEEVSKRQELSLDYYTKLHNKYGEGADVVEHYKQKYDEYTQTLEELNYELETGEKLSAEEIKIRKQQIAVADNLTTAYGEMVNASEEFNSLAIDDSATRAELNASRDAALKTAEAFRVALLAQMELSRGNMKPAGNFMESYNAQKELQQQVQSYNKIKNAIESFNKTGSGGASGTGGAVGNALFGGGGGGGGRSKKSKAEEMAESFKEEMKDLHSEMSDSVSEHQKKYDDLTKSIKKIEDEYEKLRENAKKTREDAEKSLKSYNEQLENAQSDAVKSLGQRYVELRKELVDVDRWMKEVAENTSWSEIQGNLDSGRGYIGGYNINDIIDLKQKLEELQLIEENTTEEQRKAEEFVKQTSKAQEILNKLKEQEVELEEKKAQALERQKIAEAVMNQGDGDNFIKTMQAEGEEMKTYYYDVATEKREQIHNVDNIEYAKQLSNQITSLSDQLAEFQKEKDQEVEILTSITARKVQLENQYNDVFQANISKQKASVDQLIRKRETLIAKKNEYYGSSGSARAYGGDISNAKVTLVGENGPEQIIARQASYVQPRNASNSYSTVNNDNSSTLTINGMSNTYGSIDEMLDDLKQKMTYRN